MPYSYPTFGSLKSALAQRLDDPTKAHWVDAELALHLQDAIRLWNALVGEFRQWWPLTLNPSQLWYDLQAETFAPSPSPRLCTLTDADLYTRLQYALLEPPAPDAAIASGQFSPDDLVTAVQRKRDEWLLRTGCTMTVEQLSVTPNVPTVALPETVVQARRAYWLPQTVLAGPYLIDPLGRVWLLQASLDGSRLTFAQVSPPASPVPSYLAIQDSVTGQTWELSITASGPPLTLTLSSIPLPNAPSQISVSAPSGITWGIRVENGSLGDTLYPYGAGAGASPLPRADEIVTDAFQSEALQSPSDPATFSAGTEPPLTLTLTPAPSSPGVVEALCIETQEVLSAATPTTLYLPSDLTPALAWGVLADLLDSSSEKADPARAAYARQRYEQSVELCAHLPCVMAARVAGRPLYVDAVDTLDSFDSQWMAQPVIPSIVATSGQNLVALPCAAAQTVTLLLLANATLPSADSDIVSLGREVLDAILDCAEHSARFKEGMADVEATIPLMRNFLSVAAKRNARVRALSIFKTFMDQRAQREDVVAPSEKEA